MEDTKFQIERGYPNVFIDAIGNLNAIFDKILFLDRRLENHHISQETEDYIQRYIEWNNLDSVMVRLNQYAPIGEIRRLARNRFASPLLKYSLGALTLFLYTFLPARLYGGDCYNPFTHTVNLFSDHVGIALHELGHALDFYKHKYRGLYAIIGIIPGISLVQEYRATKYALKWLRKMGEKEKEIEAYKILFPAYSTYLFGFITNFIPSTIVRFIFFPFIIIGHVIGRITAFIVRKLYTVGKIYYKPFSEGYRIINCIYCNHKLRIPSKYDSLEITCPVCKKIFKAVKRYSNEKTELYTEC